MKRIRTIIALVLIIVSVSMATNVNAYAFTEDEEDVIERICEGIENAEELRKSIVKWIKEVIKED